jgi:hypothetical protein
LRALKHACRTDLRILETFYASSAIYSSSRSYSSRRYLTVGADTVYCIYYIRRYIVSMHAATFHKKIRNTAKNLLK